MGRMPDLFQKAAPQMVDIMFVIKQTLPCGHTRTLPVQYVDYDAAETRAVHLTLVGLPGSSYAVRCAT
jgi:hypothetical protein